MAHEYLFHFIFDYSIFNICGKNDILFSMYFQLNIFLLKKYFILTQKIQWNSLMLLVPLY